MTEMESGWTVWIRHGSGEMVKYENVAECMQMPTGDILTVDTDGNKKPHTGGTIVRVKREGVTQ